MNKVKVGGVTYTIRNVNNETDSDTFGQIDHAKQEIVLHEGLGIERRQEVIWHEVVHAIDYMTRLGLKEKQVDTLGSMIQTVLADNAGLK